MRAMRSDAPRRVNYMIPCLRVRQDASGALAHVPEPNLAPYQTSESWWGSVMRDWRVRKSRVFHDPLSFHSSETIVIACEDCALRREFVTADVVKTYGGKYYLSYLRYDLAVCPQHKSFADCKVRFVR